MILVICDERRRRRGEKDEGLGGGGLVWRGGEVNEDPQRKQELLIVT